MLKKITLELYNDTCELIINQFPAASTSVELNYKKNKLFAFFSVEKASDPEAGSDVKNIRVIYVEKGYASSKIPSHRSRRELLPSDHEILIARLIDRSIRPNFPYIKHTCELNIILLNDADNVDVEILAIFLANVMLKMIFQDRYNLSVPIKLYINPSNNQISINQTSSDAQCSLLMSGTSTSVNIVEFKTTNPLAVHSIVGYIATLMSKIKQQIAVVNSAIQDTTISKFDLEHENNYLTYTVEPHDQISATRILNDIIVHCPALDAYAKTTLLKDKLKTLVSCATGVQDIYLNHLVKDAICNYYIDKKKRLDNREFDELRPITVQQDYIENAHSSVLLQRGNTHVLATATVSTVDLRMAEAFRYLYVQYIFSLFSVQELSRGISIKRREVGHGYIIEHAVNSIVDTSMIANNSIRAANDILSADGSTSIASSIATSLITLKLGINKDKQYLAGVGIGAIYDKKGPKKKIIIISDINRAEDNFGALDMKIIFNNHSKLVYIQFDIKEDVDVEDIYKCIKQGQADSSRYCAQLEPLIADSYPTHPQLSMRMCIDVPSHKINDSVSKKMYLGHRAKVVIQDGKVYLYCDAKTIKNAERTIRNMILGPKTR